MAMPSKLPRVNPVLAKDIKADLDLVAKAHFRSASSEAALAISQYLDRVRKQEPEIFDEVEFSAENPYVPPKEA